MFARMDIGKLPGDVLHMILRCAIDSPIEEYDAWKLHIPLLSICRRWRSVAAPLVYRRMYVVCCEDSSDDEGGSARTRGMGTRLNTNVNLAASTGHAHLFQPAEARRLETEIALAAAAVRGLMPSLTAIRSKGYGSGALVEALLGELAGLYSAQLARLASRRPIAVPEGACFAQMTHLDIRPSAQAGFRLPQVLAGALVSLSLRGIPTDCGWAAFTHDGGSGAIDEHCLLPASAALPARMSSLSVAGSSGAIVALSHAAIPATSKLSLSITSAAPGLQGAVQPALNRIMARAVVAADLSCTILEDTVPIDPGSVEWPGVTRLQLSAPLQMCAMVELLGRLPNLVQLGVFNVLLDATPKEAPAPGHPASPHVRVAPLNISLQELMLDHERGAYSDQAATAAIKYLALRLPLLRLLSAWTALDEDVLAFVNENKHAYPHLSGIRFSFGAGR
ncbi:hypothetical protein H4R18_000528 [Coemansia javaensis]|uniref:F-box domain-containing protein n=1 Tax=Coemansia javaensis TaxID=2761396 RepID=A0A9W8HFU8_9FUNG|nr:hypothetical protein H4R18_000528 [Coemansia javaensis]